MNKIEIKNRLEEVERLLKIETDKEAFFNLEAEWLGLVEQFNFMNQTDLNWIENTK